MFYLLFIGIAYCISISDQANVSNKCYYAKICVHDGKDKCGQDENGKVRRFLDSCDMKEYNCLNEANFMKTSETQCKDLQAVDTDQQKENDPAVNESGKDDKSDQPGGLDVEEVVDADEDKKEEQKLKEEDEANTKEKGSDNGTEETLKDK